MMQNEEQEHLTRLLTDLKAVLLAAHDFDRIRAGIEAMPTERGVAFQGYNYVHDDDHRPNAQAFGVITFTPPLPARELCQAMGWKRPYASSGDWHQTTWDICLEEQEYPALQWPRDSYESTAVGRWSIKARLSARPHGPLPDIIRGASPAYDLEIYPAEVAYFELLWLAMPTHPDFAMPELGELTGTLCEYREQGMEQGPMRVFQQDTAPGMSAMDGMHTLEDGDHLIIYTPDNEVLWTGQLSAKREGWFGITRKVYASDAPPGVTPDKWREWFQHKPALRAVLLPTADI